MRNLADTASLCLFLLGSGLFHGTLAKPAKCKQDKCFKAAQSNYNAVGAKKSAGCHAYLNRVETPIVTVSRDMETITSTRTIHVTNTVPGLKTKYTTVGSVATLTGPPQTTTTIVVKRNADYSLPATCPTPTSSTPVLPSLASACNNDASAFVSACSCIGITAATKMLAPCTTTLVYRHVSTTKVTVTVTTNVPQSTTTVPTTVVTSTSTIPPLPIATAYDVPSIDSCQYVFSTLYNTEYTNYYLGPGFSLAANNNGNSDSAYPPQSVTFPGTLPPCGVVYACADYTDNLYYQSFDLHYLASAGSWTCVAYLGGNSDSSFFNQANSDIVVAYGYTSGTV